MLLKSSSIKVSVILFAIFFSANAFAAKAVLSEEPESHKKFVEFDISGSAGNYNGQAYTELHAGLNLNFTDWLTWRNSVFKRVTAGSSQDLTGLDSSVRFNQDIGILNIYAGPGYRWASDSAKNAFLGEAGASVNVGKVTLGVGAKYLRYDQAQYDANGAETKRDDLSYFVGISGALGFAF